jgi:hypothetical protein
VTILQPWKGTCYRVVKVQEMKMKILENKGAETATQNNTIKNVALYNN